MQRLKSVALQEGSKDRALSAPIDAARVEIKRAHENGKNRNLVVRGDRIGGGRVGAGLSAGVERRSGAQPRRTSAQERRAGARGGENQPDPWRRVHAARR